MSIISCGVVDVKQFRKVYTEACRMLYQLYFLGGALVPRTVFAATDTLDLIITIRVLKGHFLIEEDTTHGRLTIHPLVQLAIRGIVEGERTGEDQNDIKQEQAWYEEVVVTFAKQYPCASCEDRSWWKNSFAQLLYGHDTSSEAIGLALATIYSNESRYYEEVGQFTQALQMTLLAKELFQIPFHKSISTSSTAKLSSWVLLQSTVIYTELFRAFRLAIKHTCCGKSRWGPDSRMLSVQISTARRLKICITFTLPESLRMIRELIFCLRSTIILGH